MSHTGHYLCSGVNRCTRLYSCAVFHGEHLVEKLDKAQLWIGEDNAASIGDGLGTQDDACRACLGQFTCAVGDLVRPGSLYWSHPGEASVRPAQLSAKMVGQGSGSLDAQGMSRAMVRGNGMVSRMW